MKILITTGIYPPKIGGPAQYAKNLKEAFEKLGHKVTVKTYGMEDRLLTGLRHLFFFIKTMPSILRADMIFTLDTFSVGLPTSLAGLIFIKKVIIRTGGDFLWEQYVERTKKKVLFRNFYDTEKGHFSLKEKIIFWLTKWTLHNVTHIIFSTEWQRDIFVKAYDISGNKTTIVENYYGPKESDLDWRSKNLIASTRKLVWKNLDLLSDVFSEIKKGFPNTELSLDNLPYDQFMNKMRDCYAVVLISLGDISPNMILDAIRHNRPFICTREVGIYDRVKEAGIFVDPLNKDDIEKAILELLTEEGYRKAKEKVGNFNFVHIWEEIAEEFLAVYKKI